jgi:magnesium-transporting ATPase (P-type)
LSCVVQAIGARNMSLQSVTVTHLGALQDVASMTVGFHFHVYQHRVAYVKRTWRDAGGLRPFTRIASELSSTQVLCCDKTGTLTDGRLSAQLHAIRTFAQYKPLEVPLRPYRYNANDSLESDPALAR